MAAAAQTVVTETVEVLHLQQALALEEAIRTRVTRLRIAVAAARQITWVAAVALVLVAVVRAAAATTITVN